jgi:MEMO1 family protein
MKRAVLALSILIAMSNPVLAQDTRQPRDSIGFCWRAGEMDSFVRYLDQNEQGGDKIPGKLVAAISVHDDYLYAGKIYYPLYKNLRAKEVVILGVTHGTVAKELGPLSNVIILDEFNRWRGPYGPVEISPLRQRIRTQLPPEYVMISNRAHEIEHSIEALVPFIQYYNRDIKITPIMVTRMPFDRMQNLSARLALIIQQYLDQNHLELGRDLCILMSNDANHYGPDFNNSPFGTDANAHALATQNDRRIISACLSGEITPEMIAQLRKEIWPDSLSKMPIPLWCGRYPVTLGLLTATKLSKSLGLGDVSGSLLRYSDTFSEKVLPLHGTSMGVTAVFSYQHWCGWFTEALSVKTRE